MESIKKEEKDYTIITSVIAIIICIVLCIGGMCLSHWYAENYFNVNQGDGNQKALLGIALEL